MKIIEKQLYLEQVESIARLNLPWDLLDNKTILISGATGMIGTFLTHVLLLRNKLFETNHTIVALSRNGINALEKLSLNGDCSHLNLIAHDVNEPLHELGEIDFMIHAASNTHPVAYATDPIGTINTNVLGTYNMLDYASKNSIKRFLFVSSVEIYGESREDEKCFAEDSCGYIDCNTLRAGYPESKRVGEALCQAYKKQVNIDIVIARLSRCYGPTMLHSDTKAISQFIKKGLLKEDIILKSSGTQYYSYAYVSDAVSGLLTALLKGNNGEAYNISSAEISLGSLANIIADYCGTNIVFELPEELEASGYSTATRAILDCSKLKRLGWNPTYSMENGIKSTLAIMK